MGVKGKIEATGKLNLAVTAAVLGLCIAAGPGLAGYFINKAIHDFKMNDRSVTVKGLAEREVKSDEAVWTLDFKLAGDNLSALHEQFNQSKDTISAFCKKSGFPVESIDTSYFKVVDLHAREYGSDKASPNRYIIEGAVIIKTENVDLVEKANQNLGELLKTGIALSGAPKYHFRKFNDLRPQMLAEATKNARQVAEQFAADSGSKVGAIRKANQGVFRITSPDASVNEEYDSGEKSINKKIRIVTTIDFFLVD